jgi:hypothetical protein
MGRTMASVGSRIAVLAAAILIAACAAISQQKAQAPRADNLDFHNLRVLPPNITHDELIATMRGFARSLGTRCNHCHVANPPGSKEEFDFASDAKEEKKTARTMLRMVRDINANYLAKVNASGQTVTCFTCHRGHTTPQLQVVEVPQQGGQQPPPPQPVPPPQP